MEEWRGVMNWKLDDDWVCEICGHRGLTWGLPHARCRCDKCHAHYTMRDWDAEGEGVLTKPICLLRPHYHEVVRRGLKKWGTTYTQWTEEQTQFALANFGEKAEHD